MKKSGILRTATASLRLGLALGLALALPTVTRAGILYWGSGGAGGSGTWDAGITTNWWDGGSDVVWPATSSGDDDAYFYGFGDTVTIAPGGVTANDLKFFADGCTIQGGTLTLDLSLTNTPILEMGPAINTVFNSVIAGTNGFRKQDVGTLTLNASNTFYGNIIMGAEANDVSGGGPACGAIRITNSAALGVANDTNRQVIVIRASGSRLELDGSGGAISLSTNFLFVTSGDGQIRNVAGTNTVNSEIALSTGVGTSGVISDGGALTLAGPIHVAGSTRNLVLKGTNSAVNTVSGVVYDIYTTNLTGLEKQGPNTWQITSSNTHSGQTVFGVRNGADGILRLANSSAIGTGKLLVTGGSQSGRVEFTGGITITNAITLEGRSSGNTRALSNLSGTNTLTGNITGVAGSGGAFPIESQAGFLTVQGGFSQTYSTGRGVYLLGAGNGLFSGNIVNGNGTGLGKRGAGVWTVSGTNSYADPTSIEAGRLQFARQVSLYSNTPASWVATKIIVTNGATAGFNVGGAGEFTAGDIAALAALGTPTNGFISGTFLGLDTANAGGDFLYAANLINPNGTNKLGLTKLGANRLILSGTNTFTGDVNVLGGQLRIANPRALDTASSRWIYATANAPLELDGATGDIVVSNNNIQTSGSVINNVAGNNTILGEIFRTTGVGGTTITSSGGTLTLAGPIKSSGVRSLTLTGSSTGANTVSGTIQDGNNSPANPNPLTKTGTGTWILSGTNTYTGTTTISAGRLIVTGSLTNTAVTNTGGTLAGTGTLQGPVVIEAAGTLEPGISASLGETLTINNDLTLAGTALVQIGKSGATPVNDSVVGVTNITYGGALIVTNATGATLADGDAFVLFSASGTKTGNFTNVVVEPAAPGLIASFNPTNGTLSLASAVVPSPTLIYSNTVSGLQFSWTGSFKLQAQTNLLSLGLTTNWSDYPGGGSSPVTVLVSPTNGSVFFRLSQP